MPRTGGLKVRLSGFENLKRKDYTRPPEKMDVQAASIDDLLTEVVSEPTIEAQIARRKAEREKVVQAPPAAILEKGESESLLSKVGRSKTGKFAEFMLLESPVTPFEGVAAAKLAREGVKRGLGRVMTNLVPTQSYDLGRNIQRIKEYGLKKSVKSVLDDLPVWVDAYHGEDDFWLHAARGADEVPYRMMFGLKPRVKVSDYFDIRLDKRTGKPYLVPLHQKAGNTTETLTRSAEEITTAVPSDRNLRHSATMEIPEKPAKGEVWSGIPSTSDNLMGDFYMRVKQPSKPNRGHVYDVYYEDLWDLGLDPKERTLEHFKREPLLSTIRAGIGLFSDPLMIKGRAKYAYSKKPFWGGISEDRKNLLYNY